MEGTIATSIGRRIRALRVQKGLSQGDIENATGLLKCYTSRVENGHTVPSLATLGRYAAAFNVPLYQLFYGGEEPPPTPKLTVRRSLEELAKEEGKSGSDARFLLRLKGLLGQIKESDRQVLIVLAKKLASS